MEAKTMPAWLFLSVGGLIAAVVYFIWKRDHRSDHPEEFPWTKQWKAARPRQTVWVLRHAEDAGNCLSDRGLIQAKVAGEQLARQLRGQPIRLLTSPEVRAAETAAIVGQFVQAEPEVRRWLGFERRNLLQTELECEIANSPGPQLVLVTHSPHVVELCGPQADNGNAAINTAEVILWNG